MRAYVHSEILLIEYQQTDDKNCIKYYNRYHKRSAKSAERL